MPIARCLPVEYRHENTAQPDKQAMSVYHRLGGILFARPMPGQMLLQKEQKVLRNYHIREQAAVKEKPAPVPALDRWFPPAKMLAVSDKQAWLRD